MTKFISSMSKEEKVRIITESMKLEAMGKKEEALKLTKLIPLKPELADDIKRLEGIQWLIDSGYNLSDAVNKFGKEWLHA